MRGRHRSGAWSLELSIWSVDDGRFEGEFGGGRDWEHRGVASKFHRLAEGALPQPDRSASKHRRYTMQTYRRQPSRPGNGSSNENFSLVKDDKRKKTEAKILLKFFFVYCFAGSWCFVNKNW